MTEMTPWNPSNIRLAIEAHHWPPPTLWIRDMLDGIASAWEADIIRLHTAEAKVLTLEFRIEALEAALAISEEELAIFARAALAEEKKP